MFGSRLDKKVVTATVKIGTCHLSDRQDCTTFVCETKIRSDKLFATPLLLHFYHIDADNKSMKNTHKSQKIRVTSSGTAF